MTNPGKVYLVGAGPGDPGLITCRAAELLMTCDAVVYDNLVPHELIVGLPSHIERIFVGKTAGHHTLPQDEINALLVKLARKGKSVVRLKGGDPFVFGRGGEEALYLLEHDVPFEIVPGVTAGVAALAYAGIPATHRGIASAVIFVTGHEAANTDHAPVVWEDLAGLQHATLVGYMGVEQLPHIVARLLGSGMPPQTPAAIIERGASGTQRTIAAPLAELPAAAEREKIEPPALFVIGDVVALRDRLAWFERLPLFGTRVMVLRPADPGRSSGTAELYRQLRALGAEVLALPTLVIVPEVDHEGWEKMKTKTALGDWLYFAGANGVNYFIQQWRQRGNDIRSLASFSIAAVGAGALHALESAGIHPDLLAKKPTTAGLAEEMAAKLGLKGRRVVRIRGNRGNQAVESILTSAGAEVISLAVYRSSTATWSEHDFQRLEKHPPDVILFSSGAAVTALAEILDRERSRRLTERAATISIGPATSAAARACGFPVTAESPIPSLAGLVQTLIIYCTAGPGS